jgi:hypothetical protein
VLSALLGAAPAHAAFGIHDFDVAFVDSEGKGQVLAGSHPYAMTTGFQANTKTVGEKNVVEEWIRNIEIAQISGLVGDLTAVSTCSTLDFLTRGPINSTGCADSTAIGTIDTEVSEGKGASATTSPVYSLEPPPGTVLRLGFFVLGVPVTTSVSLNESPPYNAIAHTTNISQVLEFFGAELTLWGVPADPRHDEERGLCSQVGGSCPAGVPPRPFLTLPRACTGPLKTEYELDSWQNPEVWVKGFAETHDDAGNPQGMLSCGDLGFSPSIEAAPTSPAASSPSGLDFSIAVNDEGLRNPNEGATAQSDIRRAVVTLPKGMTANPSLAEGLEVCTEAQLDEESAASGADGGCPDASKIGTVQVRTPLLEQSLEGSLYVAKPHDNRAGDSLIALYLVIKNVELGIVVKQALKVEPNPRTGQLVTIADDIPQLPFSEFELHFREGSRSPLITPPGCGAHQVEAVLTPWSGGPAVTSTSTFETITGVGGGSCPKGGTPPFDPGFEAGSLNNNAGSFSPFYMRLTRRDGDQDLTRFSALLPPGMVAKLAGTAQCPDGAIMAAKAKDGLAELASHSCPASSQIGRVKAGAGVGALLTYVPGSLYLAGPYNGAPLSVVAIVPAVAGPFDVGTVVTRVALRIDPRTAKVTVDGAASDPIPHILAGIPLAVRDIRVYADRPEFTINPTSCEPFEVGATLWGGGSDVFGTGDDSPLSLAARYQAADCASLGFRPRLALKLKGGTKRGGHPALTGTYRPRGGDANLAGLALRLPRSAFLDQAHIRTICTRVQFAAKACPAGAVYGRATAYTPLLDQPLSGPVYLRSSNHNLPDFVADLHGLIDVEAVARIDSQRGGIRATFSDVPDAPLTKVVVRMQGAKKGLIVNSTDLCAKRNRANARFSGHNGRRFKANPVVGATCGKGGGHKGRHG